MQTALVILLFAASLGWLGRMVYFQFKPSADGAAACGGACKCDASKNIEAKLAKISLPTQQPNA